MDIPIEFFIPRRDDTVEALREYAGRRLSFALRRFTHRVRRVTLRLIDVNGPRRGVDSRCSIAADLTDGRQIFVDATAAWPFAAITDACRNRSFYSYYEVPGRHPSETVFIVVSA